MTNKYKPPLALHFIWNPADNESVIKILDSVRFSFARDVNRPFSRGLNIPLFFYSSENPNKAPRNLPQQQAEKDIVFVFASVNTLGRDSWKDYIDNLALSDTFKAVPIAIDREGLKHCRLKNLNYLRLYEWSVEFREQRAILSISHEIYRHGFVEIDKEKSGTDSSIKIFLSHTKAGDVGKTHAESISKFIDNTNMSRFFDTTEISPGFKFDEEIIQHIKVSTLIAIESDAYSSRYWCQREILCAKEHERPIVAVDCLEDFEDRVFPAGSNVPCVHISPDTPISEHDILRILIATILETIRYSHAKKSLNYYQRHAWISANCVLSSRPPEIRQIIKINNEGKHDICYPEPPLYAEETDWLSNFKVNAFTPLWNKAEDQLLNDFKIGISISDNPIGNFSDYHMHSDQLKRLSQDMARHLLARAGTIIYGGDLRKDGFTQFILDEAIALKNRINTQNIHVENHLAWPLYLSDPDIVAWKAKYHDVIRSIHHDIPADILKDVDKSFFIAPTGTENKYIWSRCLTWMRQESIKISNARVCAGGRLTGYNGKMPGILEEIMISLEMKKPIYLLGAFGGVVSEVCNTIKNSTIPPPLTESWQITNNAEYSDLQDRAKQNQHHVNYQDIKTTLENVTIADLANTSGLNCDDYQRLMESPFVDECVHLVLKGLKVLSSKASSPNSYK